MQGYVYDVNGQPVPVKNNTALVLSILGLCIGVVLTFFCLLGFIPGLILSIIGTAMAKNDINPTMAKTLGIIGIVVNSLILLGFILLFVLVFLQLEQIPNWDEFPYNELGAYIRTAA